MPPRFDRTRQAPDRKARVCVVTTSRSDFGLLHPLIREIDGRGSLELNVLATGTHFARGAGDTWREIEAEGVPLHFKVDMGIGSDDPQDLAHAVGRGVGGLADALSVCDPDLVVVMGDRFELLALLSATTLLRIPVAHISGGEVTEGAMDDQIRHATTKCSHLHYVANEIFAARLLRMGEEPWRVVVTGEPGLDTVLSVEAVPRETLEKELGLSFETPTALIAYHPVTQEPHLLTRHLREIVAALEAAMESRGLQLLITEPNADPGRDEIVAGFRDLARRYPGAVVLRKSLGHRRFVTAMQHCRVMIGNSSSGLVEAPSWNLPAVNIGSRQAGRPEADTVVSCAPERESILRAMDRAMERKGPPPVNPFGQGGASARIAEHVASTLRTSHRDALLRKRFIDSHH